MRPERARQLGVLAYHFRGAVEEALDPGIPLTREANRLLDLAIALDEHLHEMASGQPKAPIIHLPWPVHC